jgi:hypothetical protein
LPIIVIVVSPAAILFPHLFYSWSPSIMYAKSLCV